MALLFLAAVTGLCSSAPSPARAGEFPQTAFSASQSTQPEFVDPASLIFVFPQWGGRMESQIFALDLGRSQAVGAVGSRWGQALFFLAQDTIVGQGTSLFQVGWSVAWTRLRLGLAGRMSRQESSTADLTKNDTTSRIDYSGGEVSLYEGSFGIGFGGEDLEAELAVEGSSIDSKLTDLYLRLDSNPIFSDTALVYLESDGDHGLAVTGRIRAHLGGGVEAVAVGRWGGLSNNYDGVEYVGSRLQSVRLDRDLDRWSAGLCISFPVDRLEWLGATAQYEHLEDVTRYNYLYNLELRTTETGRLALSMRQHLWKELHGQAGVSLTYVRNERHQEYLDSSGTRREQLVSDTTFGRDFSWGLNYAWRNVDLHGAMGDTLPLTYLFFSLDVRLRL